MSTALLAQDIDVILERTGLSDKARPNTRFLIVPTTEAGEGALISGEKMSRFLSLYVEENFEEAVSLAIKIQDYQGLVILLACIQKMMQRRTTSLWRHVPVG